MLFSHWLLVIISKCLIKPLSILRIHLLLKWKESDFFWHFSLILSLFWIVVVQSLSHVRLFMTHGWQYARFSCPSVSGGCSNSCALSWWWYPTILSSVTLFSSCPQSFPAPGSFSDEVFASGGQSIGVSASTSVLPMNTQDWSPLGWSSWVCLQSKGLSRVVSNTTV